MIAAVRACNVGIYVTSTASNEEEQSRPKEGGERRETAQAAKQTKESKAKRREPNLSEGLTDWLLVGWLGDCLLG